MEWILFWYCVLSPLNGFGVISVGLVVWKRLVTISYFIFLSIFQGKEWDRKKLPTLDLSLFVIKVNKVCSSESPIYIY